MRKKVCIMLILLLLSAGFSNAENLEKPSASSTLSFSMVPGMSIPIGQDKDYFKPGGDIGILLYYRFPSQPLFFLNGVTGYSLIPLSTVSSLSVLSLGIGGGVTYDVLPGLNIKGWAAGGYFLGFLNDKSGPKNGNPFFSIGAGIHYFLAPPISLGLDLLYRNYLGLHNGFGITLGASYHVGKSREKPGIRDRYPSAITPLIREAGGQILEIKNASFEDVFPMFYTYYSDHPVGKATLANKTNKKISDIEVTLFVKQYMDNPKQCSAPPELGKGEEKEIELYALFTDSVLKIIEGTKVSVEITMEFTLDGNRYRENHIDTIHIYNRSALTWDDDRKAAVFVTTKDPAVLTFSKNIAGMIKDEGSRAVHPNIRIALALHEALDLYGLSYIEDPTTPYKEFSGDKTAVDFLQFPRRTLQYKGGDCDDLSILYSALLESVGIPTAFITIPGHIYTAFSIEMNLVEAQDLFYSDRDLIFEEGTVWIPVEVTEIGGGFLKAWEVGAKEWREAAARDQEGFHPVQEAWKLYKPVSLPDEELSIELPPSDRIVRAYLEELVSFIDREILPQLEEIRSEIGKSGSTARLTNKLGVVYARYGKLNDAEREFINAVQIDRRYVPALINLGNIYYLGGDLKKAKNYYEMAYDSKPESSAVLLSVARVNHEMENYGIVKEMYGKLKALNPDLAEKYAYLDMKGDDAARAAAIGRMKEAVLWDE